MNTKNMRYKIDSVKLESFDINIESYKESANVLSNREFRIVCSNEVPIVEIKVQCAFKNIEQEQDFLSISLSVKYAIHPDDFPKVVYVKEDILFFNRYLMRKLRQEAYDSLRGALAVKTEGLSFNKYSLPAWEVPLDAKDVAMNEVPQVLS